MRSHISNGSPHATSCCAGAGPVPRVPTQHSNARMRRCPAAGMPQAAAASPGQQQQQPRLQQQQQQRRRFREGPLPPPLTNKPFVVRIAGRTSSIQGAAGAITKRLQTDVGGCLPWVVVAAGISTCLSPARMRRRSCCAAPGDTATLLTRPLATRRSLTFSLNPALRLEAIMCEPRFSVHTTTPPQPHRTSSVWRP